MIIEPVPTSSAGPLRRLVGAAGIALPVVLLIAVTAGGLLGREDVDGGDPAPATSPSPAASVTEAPSGAPQDLLDPEARVAQRVSFPAAIDGLPVRDVAATVALRADGAVAGVVAVAGYLSVREIPPACADRILGPSGALCHREGVVTDVRESPWTPPGVSWSRIGTHLHPEFPPGVRVPSQIERTTLPADGPPLPVVLLGRFDDPGATPCLPANGACRETFVVRGVVWYDGQMWRRPTALEPTLDVDATVHPLTVRLAGHTLPLGDVDRVLVIALVSPATLPTIDPVAAAALPDPAPGRVWYVLGLDVDQGSGSGGSDTADPDTADPGTSAPARTVPIGRTRWLVVDAATGSILARGGDVAAPADGVVSGDTPAEADAPTPIAAGDPEPDTGAERQAE